ncbi:MAG: NUDIX hydrolase [Thermoanaerobaculia bacterium]
MKRSIVVCALFLALPTLAQQLPDGYWAIGESAPILEKTREIRLAPDLSRLSEGERAAVGKLLVAGAIFQRLYEDQKHAQALEARAELGALHRRLGEPESTGNLIDLYRLSAGPIATTLGNERKPFLPVASAQAGKNLYPAGVTRQELEAHLAARPSEAASLMGERTVVRRAEIANLRRDLAAITRHPVLDVLHPGLRDRLGALAADPSPDVFYAVPYPVAWADELMRAYHLLREAADEVRSDDEAFAGYLDNRARDLLSNDYESGDASWVTGDFDDLNAQIGSYEVYDDDLFGVKTFFSTSVLLRNREESETLRSAIAGLQELENSLPYDARKRVRDDIPVSVYDVIADFGQARGTNTATILPNDADHARRYGRTILLRSNIMRDPRLFATTRATWSAAMARPYENDLTIDGNFYRTLWHEIGHYLGVDRTAAGVDLDVALGADSSTLEEMKADLVSLFIAPQLRKRGYYDDVMLRSVYASGIRRVLQNTRPRRDQPYQTMQLMQWNYFLERGLLKMDHAASELTVDYSRYPSVVRDLLAKVLELQRSGDRDAIEAFITRYTGWDEKLHGAIAANLRAAEDYRFTIVRYEALGE